MSPHQKTCCRVIPPNLEAQWHKTILCHMIALRNHYELNEITIDHAINSVARSVCISFGGTITSVDIEADKISSRIDRGKKYCVIGCIIDHIFRSKNKDKGDNLVLNILLKARDSAGKIKDSKRIIFTVIISHLHALIRFYKLHDPESGPDYVAIEPIRNASNIIEMIMCREYGGNEAMVIAAEAAKMSRRIYGE